MHVLAGRIYFILELFSGAIKSLLSCSFDFPDQS